MRRGLAPNPRLKLCVRSSEHRATCRAIYFESHVVVRTVLETMMGLFKEVVVALATVSLVVVAAVVVDSASNSIRVSI